MFLCRKMVVVVVVKELLVLSFTNRVSCLLKLRNFCFLNFKPMEWTGGFPKSWILSDVLIENNDLFQIDMALVVHHYITDCYSMEHIFHYCCSRRCGMAEVGIYVVVWASTASAHAAAAAADAIRRRWAAPCAADAAGNAQHAACRVTLACSSTCGPCADHASSCTTTDASQHPTRQSRCSTVCRLGCRALRMFAIVMAILYM